MNQQTVKHTELPWERQDKTIYKINDEKFAKSNIFFASVQGGWKKEEERTSQEEMEANAVFIVKACNNHYQLLEACKVALNQLWSFSMSKNNENAINLVTKAINQAEGK